MNNVIPWEYVRLRIAIGERQRSIGQAYAEFKETGNVSKTTAERCKRSNVELTRAVDEF